MFCAYRLACPQGEAGAPFRLRAEPGLTGTPRLSCCVSHRLPLLLPLPGPGKVAGRVAHGVLPHQLPWLLGKCQVLLRPGLYLLPQIFTLGRLWGKRIASPLRPFPLQARQRLRGREGAMERHTRECAVLPLQKTPLPHHRLGMTDCLPKASPWAQGRGSARHGHLL